MIRKNTIYTILLTTILFVSISPLAYAEQGTACPDCVQQQSIIGTPTPLTLSFNYPNFRGGYVASGVCMRNYGYGTINIAGVPAGSTVVQAFLYWEILDEEDTQYGGTFEGVAITGTLIANPGNPCWLAEEEGYAWVYRADVTSLIKPGINGAYSLTGFPSGVTDGSDPWLFYTTPLLEGASLVIVYGNSMLPERTVQIYDGGVTFTYETVETNIGSFMAAGSNPKAKTTYIVGDGQFNALPNNASWNGATIISDAFGGKDVIDSTGAYNLTFGRLWDTVTTDVAVLPSDTSAVADIIAQSDCITWVAQVFQVDYRPSPVGGELVLTSTPSVILMASLAIAVVLAVLAGSKLRKRLVTSQPI
jgi:hypothetical protein